VARGDVVVLVGHIVSLASGARYYVTIFHEDYHDALSCKVFVGLEQMIKQSEPDSAADLTLNLLRLEGVETKSEG
jgi:hypothetical protein